MQKEESWWVEAGKTIGLSLLLAFGIRTFVAEARFIPSGSMEPTLLVDDRLIIDKVGYKFNPPKRGDIVVFNPTQELRKQGFKDAFIKRIIGVPGDQVAIKNGQVLINNKPLQELYIADGGATSLEACGTGTIGGQPYLSKTVTVPTYHYLVLGDNRMNSFDGRCWGLVPRSDFVGRAVFRFWPPNRIGTIPEP